MNKERVITEEEFNGLLDWLAPDRDLAGDKYEAIRRRIIKILINRGCNDAEEIADEAINRVTFKLREIRQDYVGDPALYFYGVANKVHLEYLRRRRPAPVMLQPAPASDEIEQEYECLEKCMRQLPADQREMMLQYFMEDKRAKINHRKELAKRLGIALNALRIRVHRIRTILQQCVENCLEQQQAW
ncbi:MAG TPA: hypothetical protein VK619_03755 [Pyrinomonadaceae bacterium]|nr:hypothetical protein [Pyrinomonadaceae bacterium]